MGFRLDQFPLRVAGSLDHRHLRPTHPTTLHLPQHVLDPPRGRLLLLDPQEQQRPSRNDRLLHLPLRHLLLSGRRPRPLYIFRRSLPPLTS